MLLLCDCQEQNIFEIYFYLFSQSDRTARSLPRADKYPQRDWVDEANRLIAMGSTDGSVGVRSMSFFGEVTRVMI